MTAGWETKPLGEVCQFRGGGTPSKQRKDFWNGSIPWVSPKDMKSVEISDSIDHITDSAIKSSATTLIPSGSILLVVRSGILARTVPIGITSRELAVNQDLKALVPGSDVDPWFLYYALKANEQALLATVTRGATVHRLSSDVVKSLRIPLPPLEEQKRIVAILDAAFADIEHSVQKSTASSALASDLFRSRREELLAASEEAAVDGVLGDLAEIKHGYAFEGEHFRGDGEYVLLTPGNFHETGGYRDRGHKQKYFVGPIPHGYVMKQGDLLVAMTAQAPGLLGSPLRVPEGGKFLHNQRLGLVQPKPGVEWDSRFMFHLLNSESTRAVVELNATGTKVRHTSPKKMQAVAVRYPVSLMRQREIADELDSLLTLTDELGQREHAKSVQVLDLRQSLLHRAFSGQL